MKISGASSEVAFATLPEDVKAIMSLLPDNYVFYGRVAYGWSALGEGYFDILDISADTYLYDPLIMDENTNRERFCQWVRAGMQERCNDV